MTEYCTDKLCYDQRTTSEVDYVSSLMRSDETSVQVHCVCMCVVLIGVAILYSEQRAIYTSEEKRGQKTNLLIPTHITCAHTHTHFLPYCMYIHVHNIAVLICNLSTIRSCWAPVGERTGTSLSQL